tara:strand:- start:186 stop:377 length:192 start_codon:yes stop_codon:yes gene_type:complete
VAELRSLMQPALMDAHEAAEKLFGSRDHNNYKKILRLIHNNQLPHVALKGRYWIWRKKLESML